MNHNEEQQAEQLDAFLTARRSDTQTNPAELQGETKLTSRLIDLAQAAQPDPAFARKLEVQLRAARGKTAPSRTSGLKWLPRAGLAFAALAAAVILFLFFTQPPAVNAQQIVDKARATADSPTGSGIHSMELHQQTTLRSNAGETLRATVAIWFQSPDHWRAEIESTVTGANGQARPNDASNSLSIIDGTAVWYFDRNANTLTINPLPASSGGGTNVTDFGVQPDSLKALFAQASSCFDPQLKGHDTVAGRATYVVDLGPMKCAGTSAAATSGRNTLWVDQETFVVLKHIQYGSSGGEPEATSEVTSIRYNLNLDAALFSFIPSSGVTIQDFRPKPVPSASQFEVQVEGLAKQAAFPLFVPDYTAGLAPRLPRAGSDRGIQLEYVPSEQVDKSSAAILSGLLIDEQQATYDSVVKLTEGAKRVASSNGQVWLRTDAPNPVGGGADKAAYVLRDGTLVSIVSFQVGAEELVKIANSLKAVPGTHAPLPNPTAPILAAARQSVSFPVLVPTNVPSELIAEPPLVSKEPESSVTINYHAADGRIALAVVNAPLGCCDDLRTVQGQDIKLATGVTAHLIVDPGDNGGGWLLWWEQDGATVKLSGPDQTQAELTRIASSMDKTADLGQTEAPPVRPTPGPLPAPKFTVLEPAWLPEVMTKQQDYQKAPPEFGSWVAISFLPTAVEQVRTPLLMLEKPLALMPPRSADPQATIQKIGRYQVTVTRTANECWNYDWEVGDLHLSLANAFNQSGSARFTCEQMARIVESIR